MSRTVCVWIPHWVEEDPGRSKSAAQILNLLYQFSPLIGREFDHAFLLGLSGVETLYRSELELTRKIFRVLQDAGFAAMMAVADTPLSAWLIVQQLNPENNIFIVPQGQDEKFLGSIPLTSLPLPQAVFEICQILGLKTTADLQKIPTADLIRRFGKTGSVLAEQSRGLGIRHFKIETPTIVEEASLNLDHPSDELEALLFMHKHLLDRLIKQVGQQKRVIATIEGQWTLFDRQTFKHRFSPAEPTLDRRTLLELIRLWLETAPFSAPVDVVCLRAVDVALAEVRQLWLFDRQEEATGEAWRRVISELVAMFGRESVVRPALENSFCPELRMSWKEVVDKPEKAKVLPPPSTPMAIRPLIFNGLEKPQSICLDEQGSLYLPQLEKGTAIIQRDGPYCVEGDWWGKSFRREYYWVRLADESQCWIYRDLETADSGWLLQSYLD